MTHRWTFVIGGLGMLLLAPRLDGQDLSTYRAFDLGSTDERAAADKARAVNTPVFQP